MVFWRMIVCRLLWIVSFVSHMETKTEGQKEECVEGGNEYDEMKWERDENM
jgi:hypothetical protein